MLRNYFLKPLLGFSIRFKYFLLKRTLRPIYTFKTIKINITYKLSLIKSKLLNRYYNIKKLPSYIKIKYNYYRLRLHLFIEYEKRWRKTFPKPYRMVPRLFPKIHNTYFNDSRIRFWRLRKRWWRRYHRWRYKKPILKSPFSNVFRVSLIENHSVFFFFWVPTLYYSCRFLHLVITEDWSAIYEFKQEEAIFAAKLAEIEAAANPK